MNCVRNLNFEYGCATLFNLEELKCPSNFRRYVLATPVSLTVTTDTGILKVHTEKGFIFDGRSGPSIIDWYAPNLGSLEERAAWFVHDCLGYGQSLSFKDTNLILKYILRDCCGYRKSKAEVIRLAVSLCKSWYGKPEPGDPWYQNQFKVSTEWVPFASGAIPSPVQP